MKSSEDENEAKAALEKIIRKSRVHAYKPIQLAEILHHHRVETYGKFDLEDLESYRNSSKIWRDEVTRELVGRASTSSQKYQDNLFEANAMPPKLLARLGRANKQQSGVVEAFIYGSFQRRLELVRAVQQYIEESTAKTFDLLEVTKRFVEVPGLKRSIDKMYEITVYALFSTIVRALRAEITLRIDPLDWNITKDFEPFIQTVLGIAPNQTAVSMPASLYRAGVANAADTGVDMWTNFGPIVQVKHLTLTPEEVEEKIEDLHADRVILVVKTAEKNKIYALLKQVGFADKVQGIITLDDLERWYRLCTSAKYQDTLGKDLIRDLLREFNMEFPSTARIEPFIKKRGYDKIQIPPDWRVK